MATVEEVLSQIDRLREVAPTWIRYVESPQGRKMKLDKARSLEAILKLIK